MVDVNSFKVIPKKQKKGFGLCVYGEPSEEIKAWAVQHQIRTVAEAGFTNFFLDNKLLSEIFPAPKVFKYLDGFSPNLGKRLHLGHWSNMVLAKAFSSLGVAERTIALFGDTAPGAPENSAEKRMLDSKIYTTLTIFNYKINDVFYASSMHCDDKLLLDGDGEYSGTKIFDCFGEKIVGIKSNGKTTYFYQDVAMAAKLNAPTLYTTANEQNQHFASLKKMFPQNEHVGLGLVSVSGKTLATREGNAILIDDFIQNNINLVRLKKGEGEINLGEYWNNDYGLLYNVFAGNILKSAPTQNKSIDVDSINNPRTSLGLYISYTMARLKSAGLEYNISQTPSLPIEFAALKAKTNYAPNLLFDALVELCREINAAYGFMPIKGNDANAKFFQTLLSDLLWGCNKLGLFFINKV